MSKLIIFLLLTISLVVQGSRICYKCTGIQCSRTSHTESKICDDSLDACVTIFDEFNVVESGCSGEIPSNLIKKCSETMNNEDEYDDNVENTDCLKCNEDYCNNKGRKEYQCIQCDSNMNPDCKYNPNNIKPTLCPIPTSQNSYCFTEYKDDQTIIRGCSGNLRNQRNCLLNSNCILCLAGDMENCNVAQYRDSGTGGSNTTTTVPPNTNGTTVQPNHNTTATPNVTGGGSNTTTPNVTGGGSNNGTTVLPNNNTTATPKPTAEPSSANTINFTMTLLILSIIFSVYLD